LQLLLPRGDKETWKHCFQNRYWFSAERAARAVARGSNPVRNMNSKARGGGKDPEHLVSSNLPYLKEGDAEKTIE